MIALTVTVDDWDTGKAETLLLPCNLRQYLDLSHELQVTDWEDTIPIGTCNDIETLNDVLEQINDENPTLTNHLLSEMLKAVQKDLGDYGISEKLIEGNFMLEAVPADITKTDDEKCARFLATMYHVPFAKNITIKKLEEMDRNKDQVNWKIVWEHYKHMGFRHIRSMGKLYVLHWG